MQASSKYCGSSLLAMTVVCLLGSVSAALAAEDRHDAAARQFAAAVALQNKGEFALAADEWAKFINEHKNDVRRDSALLYLGVCRLKLDDVDGARKAFQAVIEEHSTSKHLESAFFHRALASYVAGQKGAAESFDTAASEFAEFVKKFPESKQTAQSLFYQGESLYARGRKEEAAKLYAQVILRNPADDRLVAEALYALGVTKEELGDHAAAAAAYDQFLERFPKHPLRAEVTMRRGECHLAQNDFAAAVKRFAEAASVEGFPAAAYALLRQGDALTLNKQWADATRVYTTLIERFPQSEHVSVARLAGGRLHYQAGDYASALNLLDPLVKGTGDPPTAIRAEAVHWTARSLLKQRRAVDALKLLAPEVVAQFNDTPSAASLLIDRADALYDIPEQRAAAASAYAEAADKFPQSAEASHALYMAAFTALEVRQYGDALRWADQFMKKYANHELTPDVVAIAAESALQLKDYRSALEHFDRLVAQYASRPEIEQWIVRRGLARYLQKQYAETIATLEPSLKQLKSPEAIAEAYFLIGASRLAMKEYAAAAEALTASRRASDRWASADEAVVLLAAARFNNGEKAAAIDLLRAFLKDSPQSKFAERATFHLAEYLSAEQRWDEAAAEYNKFVKSYPKSEWMPASLLGLGWVALKRADYTGAESTINRMEQEFGNNALFPKARYLRALARQHLGKFEEAAADVKAYAAGNLTDIEKAEADYLLAVCQSGMKRFDDALALLRPLAERTPPLPFADRVYYELGWTLKSLGREEEAYQAFAKVKEIDPKSPLAAECDYHVGDHAYRTKQFAQAAERFSAAVAAADNDDLREKALHKMGWSLFMNKDYASAQKAFEDQLRRYPAGSLAPDAKFMIAESLFEQKKYAEAEKAYQSAPKSSIANAEVLRLLHQGQSCAQQEKWNEALSLFERIIKEHSGHAFLPEAMYEKGAVLRRLNRLDEAIKAWESVIAETSGEVAARAQFMIGQVQFERKQHEDAIKSFFRVIYGYGIEPWSPDAMYEAARCFEVLKKPDQALKLYEELAKKYPQSDKVPLARDRITELNKSTKQ